MLRSLERDLEFLGSEDAAGGGGLCLLLVGPDGAFREVAGGSGSGSGWLNWFSGGSGEGLKVGLISGQKETQVFVVKLVVCGGRGG